MNIPVFDTNVVTTKVLDDLKVQGTKVIIRYISPINLAGSKTVKHAEANAILDHGMALGFVCEGWGGSNNFSHQDITATTGTRDGATCGHWMDELGAPSGTAVYAAVDNDTNPRQINALCIPYFKAFRMSLPSSYKLGAYGCGALLQILLDQKLVDYTWLTNAMGWSGSRTFRASNKWDILQALPQHVDGLDTDPDTLNPTKIDFGFWKK